MSAQTLKRVYRSPYDTGNRCSKCKRFYPKDVLRCPTHGIPLRTKPRSAKCRRNYNERHSSKN